MSTGKDITKKEYSTSVEWWDKIKEEYKGVSLKEIAQGINVNQRKVYRWCSGEQKMSLAEKKNVVNYLENCAFYDGFRRMKDEDFAKLLSLLLAVTILLTSTELQTLL